MYINCRAPWKISESQAADSSISSDATTGFPNPPVGVTTDSFTTGDSSSPYFTLPTTSTASDESDTTTGKCALPTKAAVKTTDHQAVHCSTCGCQR